MSGTRLSPRILIITLRVRFLVKSSVTFGHVLAFPDGSLSNSARHQDGGAAEATAN